MKVDCWIAIKVSCKTNIDGTYKISVGASSICWYLKVCILAVNVLPTSCCPMPHI